MARASASFFPVVGLSAEIGRVFTVDDDKVGAPGLVVLSHGLWQRRFGGEQNVLGQTLTLNGEPYTVIGVAPPDLLTPTRVDFWTQLARGSDNPGWQNRGNHPGIRATNNPAALTNAVRHAVLDVDPNQPIWDARTLNDRIGSTFATPRLYTFLLAIFAGLALGLAAVGLYGVLAYQVSRRTREFGIRLALGALASQVTVLVLRRGLRLLALGLAFGFLGALALGRVLGTLLYRTSAFDAGVLGGVAGLLAMIALLACWLPARRAARVDPLVALRAE